MTEYSKISIFLKSLYAKIIQKILKPNYSEHLVKKKLNLSISTYIQKYLKSIRFEGKLDINVRFANGYEWNSKDEEVKR